jgi:cytochrome b
MEDEPAMAEQPHLSGTRSRDSSDAGGEVSVPVWDWPVRLFHWSLVALLVAAVVTAKIGGNAMAWHMRAGMAILTLVLFRILWGFAGSRHARFASFVRGPGAVMAYLRSVLEPPRQFHAGHNPLGGWSVVAMLLVLLAQATSGLFANDDIATDGPLVRLVSKATSDAITWFHHRNFWVLATLATLHVAAVAYHFVALRDDLVRPMITGVKRLPSLHAAEGSGPTPTPRALLLLALAALAVWGGLDAP